jgi:hypothetical protein
VCGSQAKNGKEISFKTAYKLKYTMTFKKKYGWFDRGSLIQAEKMYLR